MYQLNKLRMMINQHREDKDFDKVVHIANMVINTLISIDQVKLLPDNYVVQCEQPDGSWFSLDGGTKDYCIGFAMGSDQECRVIIGNDFVVWPEGE